MTAAALPVPITALYAGLLALLNPINHARTPEQVERYKVEPYVMAALASIDQPGPCSVFGFDETLGVEGAAKGIRVAFGNRKLMARDSIDIEAYETRVLVGRHPDDHARLNSAPFPEGIVARFMQG